MRISDWSSDVCSSDLTRGVEIEMVDIRHAAGCMDHQIAIDDLGLLRCLVGNRETGAILVDFQNLGPGPQIDSQLPGRIAENVGGIRIEIAARLLHHLRSEERRVGVEGVSTGKSRGETLQ